MGGGIRPKKDFNRHQQDMVKVGLQSSLELHSSNMKMEMEEYDNKIKNQTIVDIEKIIDNLEDEFIDANDRWVPLKEKIKNQKIYKYKEAENSNG